MEQLPSWQLASDVSACSRGGAPITPLNRYGAVQKNNLPCRARYANILPSAVRDTPPFPPWARSSILLLWWNPARPPRPRFFLARPAPLNSEAADRRLTDPWLTYYYPRLC